MLPLQRPLAPRLAKRFVKVFGHAGWLRCAHAADRCTQQSFNYESQTCRVF